MNRFQNLPMNARKARMGSSLRPRDGTHPDANRIYDASLTLAPLSDATRRRIGLRIIDGDIEVAGDGETAVNPANLAHVLTERGHQSGWGGKGCSSIGSGAVARRPCCANPTGSCQSDGGRCG